MQALLAGSVAVFAFVFALRPVNIAACCCLIASSCFVAVTSISLFLIASSSSFNCLSFLYFSVRCSTALACSFIICPLLPPQRRHRSFPLAAIDFKAFCRKSSAAYFSLSATAFFSAVWASLFYFAIFTLSSVSCNKASDSV